MIIGTRKIVKQGKSFYVAIPHGHSLVSNIETNKERKVGFITGNRVIIYANKDLYYDDVIEELQNIIKILINEKEELHV